MGFPIHKFAKTMSDLIKDETIKPEASSRLIDSLKALNAPATLTLYPGVAIAEMKFMFQTWHADPMKRAIINDVR